MMLEVRESERRVVVVGWVDGSAIGVGDPGARHSTMVRISSRGRKGLSCEGIASVGGLIE
jgi:hypothetical protein